MVEAKKAVRHVDGASPPQALRTVLEQYVAETVTPHPYSADKEVVV
jgi:hypothetical protein